MPMKATLVRLWTGQFLKVTRSNLSKVCLSAVMRSVHHSVIFIAVPNILLLSQDLKIQSVNAGNMDCSEKYSWNRIYILSEN